MQNELKNQKIEKVLNDSLSENVAMSNVFEQNLDKIVANSIEAEKGKTEIVEETKVNGSNLFTRGLRWQISVLSVILLFVFVGGVTFAAVPSVREIFVEQTGEISIKSLPDNAEIYVIPLESDDKSEMFLGNTPLDRKLDEGRYTLEVRLDGYDTYSKEFVIEKGKSISMDVNLEKELK